MSAASPRTPFSADYTQARAVFLHACAEAGGEIASHRHPRSAFSCAMALETEDRELDLATVRAGMAALLADPSRGRAFVVEAGGEVIALLVLTLEWSDWRNGFFWWIQNVYVSPAQRRRGHYRRLHEHVRALAERDPDVCGLRLYVEVENAAAQATYRACTRRTTGCTRRPRGPAPDVPSDRRHL